MAAASKGKPRLALAGAASARDRVWLAIREQPEGFGYEHLQKRCRGMGERNLERYVLGLLKAGFLERLDRGRAEGQFTAARYRLVRDVGLEAPRIDRHGRPIKRGEAGLALWRAMKILKTFSLADLVVAAGTDGKPADRGNAKSYCRYLARAGYLTLVRQGGGTGRSALYRLVRDSGPLAPAIRSDRHVFDPNTGEVAWYPEEEIA